MAAECGHRGYNRFKKTEDIASNYGQKPSRGQRQNRAVERVADMQVYKVGGAVRDELLGRPVNEEDYVVVGARPEQMLAAGYTQVGRDFPVFLHPETKAEYALARIERKTGPGYHGFTCRADPEVTLEEDLGRRDFTVNAMARAADGTLVDPYGGARDLTARVLRHVSPAFAEDPVRILRGARFAARYAPLGFRVAPETLTLMRSMVAAGEADHLVPERVWKEWQRALTEDAPQVFLEVLHQVNALARVAPELEQALAAPHGPLDLLRAAAQLSPDPEVRFATCLLPLASLPEASADAPIESLCERLCVPNSYRELASKVAKWRGVADQVRSASADTVLGMLEGLDGMRRPQRFEQFLLCCEAAARATTSREAYPQATCLRRCLQACRAETAAPLLARGLNGPALGQALRRARIQAVEAVLTSITECPS